MAISGPPAHASAQAAATAKEAETTRGDAGDLIGNVSNREMRQEMMKTLKATFDRIHLLSSMDEELKRQVIRDGHPPSPSLTLREGLKTAGLCQTARCAPRRGRDSRSRVITAAGTVTPRCGRAGGRGDVGVIACVIAD